MQSKEQENICVRIYIYARVRVCVFVNLNKLTFNILDFEKIQKMKKIGVFYIGNLTWFI